MSLFLLCRLTFFPSSGAVFERYKMLTAVLDKEFIFPRGESTELVNTVCSVTEEVAHVHPLSIHVCLTFVLIAVSTSASILCGPRDDKAAVLEEGPHCSPHCSEGC